MTDNATTPHDHAANGDALAAMQNRAIELHDAGHYMESEFPVTGPLMMRCADDIRTLLAAVAERDQRIAVLEAENDDLRYVMVHSYYIGQRVYIAHLADAWRGGHGIVEKINGSTLTIRSKWNGEYIEDFPAVLVSAIPEPSTPDNVKRDAEPMVNPVYRVGDHVRVVNTDSDDTFGVWIVETVTWLDNENLYDYGLKRADGPGWTVWGASNLMFAEGGDT